MSLPVQCRDCHLQTTRTALPGGGFALPRKCDLANGPSSCSSLDPWQVLPAACTYADQQSLKLQVRASTLFVTLSVIDRSDVDPLQMQLAARTYADWQRLNPQVRL